jgi:phytoene/squalene synthetase
MIIDRDFDLLKEAVSELTKLKEAAGGPTRFLAHLYASALEEWAGRIRMDPLQLNKLVLAEDAAPGHSPR